MTVGRYLRSGAEQFFDDRQGRRFAKVVGLGFEGNAPDGELLSGQDEEPAAAEGACSASMASCVPGHILVPQRGETPQHKTRAMGGRRRRPG
jgi:hypothetical protein